MSEENKYVVNTLYDIAKIPQESLPRFYEEFPKIIDHIRDVQSLSDGSGGVLKPIDLFWIDDGAGDLTTTIKMLSEDEKKDYGSLTYKGKLGSQKDTDK